VPRQLVPVAATHGPSARDDLGHDRNDRRKAGLDDRRPFPRFDPTGPGYRTQTNPDPLHRELTHPHPIRPDTTLRSGPRLTRPDTTQPTCLYRIPPYKTRPSSVLRLSQPCEAIRPPHRSHRYEETSYPCETR
jgi:hypothetical protein